MKINEDRQPGTMGPAEGAPDIKNNRQEKKAWTGHAGNWKTYAAAAGATLAMAANASADIIYSGPLDVTVSVPFTGNNHSTKTFSIAGFIEELRIQNHTTSPVSRMGSAKLAGHIGLALTHNVLHRYNSGQSIQGLNLATAGTLRRVRVTAHSYLSRGQFYGFPQDTATGFIGFKLSDGDLGWIQVKVSDRNSDSYPDEAEVIAYAYNNVAGGSIDAGQLPPVPTPEPGSAALALFALGASGIIAWRRRRAAAAVK